MKLAYVVPRYGKHVVGGAESATRNLAERMVGLAGWEVEVLTTCAVDYLTWQDHYPAGETTEAGVKVTRFPVRSGRAPGFSAFSDHVLFYSRAATDDEAEQWVELQGPVCPELLEVLPDTDADIVAFYPYQYYPTVRGIASVSDRAVMHPAAHDDPPLYLPIFQSVFSRVSGFVFQTHGEREVVQSAFQVASQPQVLLGMGVDEPTEGSPAGPSARDQVGLGDRPYLCCLGRVDDLKGTSVLAEMFASYKRRRPGALAMTLVGPVAVRPMEHPDIFLTGPVEEDTKWELLRGATALVSPSPYESFSLVIMEAWTAGIPVAVNAYCEATKESCERSGGGVWFCGYAQFEAIVDRLLADTELRKTLADRGRAYVDANFRWPVIIEKYSRFLNRVAAKRALKGGSQG